nr:MAG TPA: PolyVal ADP-Ribosyltransferase [Crassvirales sp.]
MAPNGESSILFQDLLELTGDINKAIEIKAKIYTKPFIKWFGNSKAVDENGEPRIFYHGTDFVFSNFEIDTEGVRGKHKVHDKNSFFFTDNPKKAFKYKHTLVVPVFLKYENPGVSDVTDGKYKTIREYTD